MIKVFIGKCIPDLPLVEVIMPNLGVKPTKRWTDRHIHLSMPIVEIVEDPALADALLIQHNYSNVKNNREYLQGFWDLSRSLNKKIIIFYPGDSDQSIVGDNLIVFRNSQYRFKLKDNEIIMPGYVEDLGESISDLKPKAKEIKAVIGFCGWAGSKSKKEQILFSVSSMPIYLKQLFIDKKAAIFQRGLWWRKKIIKIIGRSESVQSNFIIRRSYSGNEKTIEMDTIRARQEYIDNILKSDFTLCVKGDGNFSTRFFEVLSLGRIPLLIDTDCILPLENIIDYNKFVLRVDYKEIKSVDKIVADFYANVDEGKWKNMQNEARLTFEKYLRLDVYFEYIFENIMPDLINK